MSNLFLRIFQFLGICIVKYPRIFNKILQVSELSFHFLDDRQQSKIPLKFDNKSQQFTEEKNNLNFEPFISRILSTNRAGKK